MGAVFALFAGWYHWTPKMIGVDYNETLAKIHFWIFFIGVNLTKRRKFYGHFKGKRLNHHSSGGYPQGDNFVMFFEDVKFSKRDIYKQLRNKSGVYLFINKITGDFYVGSSLNLSKRMTNHFYYANSTKDTKIVLIRAMRKYKLNNFSLAILEFCEKDLLVCLDLEQKWIDYYKPKYNVLKIVGSSSGFRHSIDTINKLKQLFKKENHPKYGSISSVETRQAISEEIKQFYRTHTHPSKGLKGILSPQYGIGGQFVFCYNTTGKELIFPSINFAVSSLNQRDLIKEYEKGKSLINSALLKYGYSNFQLETLEYYEIEEPLVKIRGNRHKMPGPKVKNSIEYEETQPELSSLAKAVAVEVRDVETKETTLNPSAIKASKGLNFTIRTVVGRIIIKSLKLINDKDMIKALGGISKLIDEKPIQFFSEKGNHLIFPSINAAKVYFNSKGCNVKWTTIKKNLDSNSWIDLKGEKWVVISSII